MSEDQASFVAAFPPILSAIRAAGDGGMRIMVDIPESDIAEGMKLFLWRDRLLRVTVEPEPDRR